MAVTALYNTDVTSVGGRVGHVRSADGALDAHLDKPAALGGPTEAQLNPETLFASAYAACFGGAVGAVAKDRDVTGFTIRASVGLGKEDSGGFALSVTLTGHFPNLDAAEAQKVMHMAHQVCPYSKATRNNIDVHLAVE